MNPKKQWTLFILCLLSLDSSLQVASAQGFGRTKEELEQTSQRDHNRRPLKNISLFRPSERYKAEIPLPLKSLTFEQGSKIEYYSNRDIIGYFDSKGTAVKGNFKIPAAGTYNLELVYRTGSRQPSPFTIKIGNRTFNWETQPSFLFQPYVIGPLTLPAGECPLAIIQQNNQESSLCLSSMRLIPAIFPASQLVLRAESAWLDTNGPRCIPHENVSVWKNFKDKNRGGTWEFDIPETGPYAVEVDYQSRLESSKDFVVLLPSRSMNIPWKAEPTQGRFMTKTVGVLQLNKGHYKISLRAEEAVMESDFGILLVTLNPLSSQETVAITEILRQNAPAPTTVPSSSPAPGKSKDVPYFGVAVFPELAKRPESENSLIAQDQFAEIYKTKTERLRNKYIATLKKIQQKYAQYQDFAAVAAIQEMIKNPNTPSKDTGIPKEVDRFVKAYEVQKSQLEEQIKQSYIQELRQVQAGYAEKQQFDKIAEIQKTVKRVEEISPQELFTQQQKQSSTRYLVGTWEYIYNDQPIISITINPDGTCSRYNKDQKAVLGAWKWAFQVRKIGENKFIFYSPSTNSILGRFHFVDDDTIDMPYGGSAFYKRKKQ